jgi:hypothetical protein
MSGKFGEDVQRQHGGGMKITALPGMLPEDLHHCLIGKCFEKLWHFKDCTSGQCLSCWRPSETS